MNCLMPSGLVTRVRMGFESARVAWLRRRRCPRNGYARRCLSTELADGFHVCLGLAQMRHVAATLEDVERAHWERLGDRFSNRLEERWALGASFHQRGLVQ